MHICSFRFAEKALRIFLFSEAGKLHWPEIKGNFTFDVCVVFANASSSDGGDEATHELNASCARKKWKLIFTLSSSRSSVLQFSFQCSASFVVLHAHRIIAISALVLVAGFELVLWKAFVYESENLALKMKGKFSSSFRFQFQGSGLFTTRCSSCWWRGK